MNTQPISVQASERLMTLVETALSQDKLSGISEMLRSIAEALDACGCILWEVAPGSKIDETPPSGHLFVLAQWFCDDRIRVIMDLPLDRSVVGSAILSGESVNVEDVWQDERVYTDGPYLSQAGIKSMCAAPLDPGGGIRGVVSLYRNSNAPFGAQEVAQAERLISLVPALYHAIRDRVSSKLIGQVNDILQEADLRAPLTPFSADEAGKVFQQICALVAETFQCVETSIFLEDQFESPGEYNLVATTWPRLDLFKQKMYRAGDGLTGWVLQSREPVNIFDLANLDRDWEVIQNEYPGLPQRDVEVIKATARQMLDLPDGEWQPLSFLAAPIIRGGRAAGVIRCWAARQGPFYFAKRELNLLGLVAVQISRYWNNKLIRRELAKENESWQALVRSVSELNSFVQNELIRETPNQSRIFASALKAASKIIGGADKLDVRLLDKQKRELYFAEVYGNDWNERRKQRRFQVDDTTWIGSNVFQTGKTQMSSLGADGSNHPAITFPDAKHVIVAPIKVEDKTFGVLDVWGMGRRAFPDHTKNIVELLGQQLGLYYYLADTMGKLRKAEAALGRQLEERSRTFEDLAHQLKTPITQAHARAQTTLAIKGMDEKVRMNLQAIRSLCRKAKRVTMSISLFSTFAREESIHPNLSRLQYQNLVKLLNDASADNEIAVGPGRRIRFRVIEKGFESLYTNEVRADLDLLEQAVNNILDNAAKYSFPNTTVEIYGGVTRTSHFYLAVINRGLAIRPNEVKQSVERGWRSDDARLTTGEGSGIGLWIVDHIMKAHDGELLIIPTKSNHLTEVRLVFPGSNI
jgi:signal transduction histidine kinase